MEVVFGEVGEETEIVNGMKTDTLAAKRVDGFRLLEAQVRVTLQSGCRTAVYVERLDSSSVGCEMMQEGVEMVVGEGFIGELKRRVKTT